MAIARDIPSLSEASNPEPIANPSGKLCIANPILTIIPVFNSLFFSCKNLSSFFNFLFSILLFMISLFFTLFIIIKLSTSLPLLLNFLSTSISHIIIITIPTIIPKITIGRLAISKASGINSKQIIAVIRPDANDNIKLKNLFEVLFNFTPIIPPRVVPNVPKNSPIKVVFIIASKMYSPFHFVYYYIYFNKPIFIH